MPECTEAERELIDKLMANGTVGRVHGYLAEEFGKVVNERLQALVTQEERDELLAAQVEHIRASRRVLSLKNAVAERLGLSSATQRIVLFDRIDHVANEIFKQTETE